MQTQPPGVTLLDNTYIDLLCDPVINESAVAMVNFTWIGPPDNTIITEDETLYTITNQPTNSTLRIESLDLSRDHGSVYTCVVSAALNLDFDIDTLIQLNSSVTLSVDGIENDLFFP